MWRDRSVAVPVMAIMALGIGSCVAIFSMVSAVLLADLGYADASRLGIVWHARAKLPGVVGVSPGDYTSHRATLATFDQLAAVTTRGFNLGGSATPSRVTCARMTADMFPMLGVRAAQGSWFTAEDDRASTRVVVLSHQLWTTRLGGDPGLIGRDVMLDAVPYRVVGVMPETFAFPPEGIQGLAAAECWVPASFTAPELAIPAFNCVILGRLKHGVSWEHAGADAHAGARKIWATYPAAVQSQVPLTARVVPLTEQVVAASRNSLYLFAGSVGILLLIACANVSNLMLTSFDVRRRELAVRASLGATRSTLIVQLLTESTVLALAGAVAGVLVAYGLLGAIAATNAAAFPRLGQARIDGVALMFAVACAVTAGVAAGLAPAMRAGARTMVGQAAGLRTAARGFGGDRWRRGLIGLEMALAVLVLVLAGVLTRSVMSLDRVRTGLVVDDLMTFSVALPAARYERAEHVAAFSDRLLLKLRALPGVTEAAGGSSVPIGEATAGVVVPVNATPSADYRPTLVYAVTPEYARAFGIAVRSGRFLESTDAASVGDAAVVNEELARSLWADGGAVGRTIGRIGSPKPLTVVGVSEGVRQSGPHRPVAPAIYVALGQSSQPIRSLSFVIRSQASSVELASRIRRAVSSVDTDVPAFSVRSGAEMADATTATPRFNMLVVGIFAVFALALAMTGLYGVVARSVEEARRDFGIRQALGATAGAILRLVMTRALMPAIAGVTAGALAAWWASELIGSLLFGVKPGDPITFAAVLGSVLVASGLVVLRPALHAVRADLVALLRHE